VSGTGTAGGTAKIWETDNPPSVKWPLYTRGNVGEVFPEVVLPFTWDLIEQAAEDGWREAFVRMGLVGDGDFDESEPMTILSVFGGYCYINASYVRMLGVRAPGGDVATIDETFFGGSDAPGYVARDGDKNRRASLKLAATVLRLLNTKDLPALRADKVKVDRFASKYPAAGADGAAVSDEQLLDYCLSFPSFFQALFARHIENTFSDALVSGALTDLVTKAGKADLLVSILGGIGDVESAAPAEAMWELSRLDRDDPAWDRAFASFIARFGSRGPNEWDLGSDPWDFRPEMAEAAIDAMRPVADDRSPAAHQQALVAAREAAVVEVRKELNRLDRFQFDKALASTIVFSQARERSKTTVIAAIHAVRRAQQALHERAVERGGVAERWKSCLLNIDEFKEYLADPSTKIDLIEERALLHGRLSALVAPFIIEGSVPPIETWEAAGSRGAAVGVGDVLDGISGCPGVARGIARVVLDPADPRGLGPGDVLVAPITDPSWTPLFLAAEAVIVDVGAVMSHAVIVSRELGIPCVVSVSGATTSIPDGALVEVDGNAGTVRVIELP
jgi:phosphohistidine swiveling domain-containing protein